jgi:hypothetical protein
MAEASELSKADIILRSTRQIVDWLPDVAARWHTWNEDIQADFTLEWMALMTNLGYVPDQIASGSATPEQTAAYRQLQTDLRAAAPILRTLELHVPPELLQDTTPEGGRRRSA